MSDIFVSYARQDQVITGELAYALGREGWSVWWDSELLPGQAFGSAIEQELRAARCVIAMWSPHSVESRWVRDEATQATERGILIPVLIADVMPPLGLRETQCADLRAWDGTVSHRGFAALTRAIHRIAGAPAPRLPVSVTRKICLIGASGVGKTSLVRRYVRSVFSEHYLSTVGVKIDRKDITVGDSRMTLLVWDIEGFDDLREPLSGYVKGMSGYFSVIDGTRPQTLQRAIAIDQRFQDTSQAPVPRIALLNKADLTDEWAVDDKTIESLREHGWDVPVVSAKTGAGVDDAFRDLSVRLLSRSWTFQDLRFIDIGMDFSAEPEETRLLGLALARNTNNFLAWARLAGVLAQRRDSGLADKAIVRAEQSTPDVPHAHIALAEELVRSNRPKEATAHLERAINLGADALHPSTRLLLASLYLRLGSTRRAVEQYELCLIGSPTLEIRQEAESRLRELKSWPRKVTESA